jgi:hypothetical protein
MDATEIGLVRQTFESALATGADDAVALLGELGWAELYDAEPTVATAELFEAQGRLRQTTSALDVVVAIAFGEELKAGTAVVHPGLGAWDRPPGFRQPDGTVHVDGLVLAGLERADRLVIPFADGDGLGIADVELAVDPVAVDPIRAGATGEGAGVRCRPVAGLDPSLRLVSVTGTIEVPAGAGRPTLTVWEAVAGAARRALAHELCGLTQAMLDRTAAHVTDRHQFGRPIAAFQTVRHRLTEVFVALASARAALDAGWATGEPFLGDAAKALAGRAGLLAARHCLQVTGAIGFTEEYELAAAIRRVHLLDALYGSADALTARIGSRLLSDRSLPRLHPLP